MTDEEIIRSFPRYEGAGIPGFVVDFLGIKTRTAYIADLPQQGGVVEGYPIPGNFHASATEWAGALRATLDATEELVAIELGAGWAPWLVAMARAARLKGTNKVRLVGVEGSKQHHAFMLSHFADNGLDPQSHTLLHGVVGTADGVAEFPLLPDPSTNWGHRAVFTNANGSPIRRLVRKVYRALKAAARPLLRGSARPRPRTERVPCYSLATLLRPFPRVDLLHVDIQGDEYAVLSGARRLLQEKVKRIVVGTHSRAIEQGLLDELAPHSWVLEAEESCKYRQDGPRMVLVMDGCQVWRNASAEGGRS
jgi:FkbM family methyltransferase